MKKQTVLNVQDYFRQKLINGEFKISEITEHTTEILIDGFRFIIWTGNEEFSLRTYQHTQSFMQIPELTKEEKEIAWSHFKQPIEDFRKNELQEQKRKQFEQLRKELNIPA